MIRKILSHIAAYPLFYNLIQYIAGSRFIFKYLSIQASTISPSLILDLGGGTGLYRKIWPPRSTYICLDNDRIKLMDFHKNHPDCVALLADATITPLKDESVDTVVCIAVSHHLSEDSFEKLIQESTRMLKDSGTFLFVDAVLSPQRRVSKLLWKYDRGSYPHTFEYLYTAISRNYSITHSQRFTTLHEIILFRGEKLGNKTR